MGLIGGSFFYGEVVITPAVSVLSAIEGLEIAAPSLDSCIVPLAIAVLTLLFVIQKHGTGIVGKLFAPVMLLWFIILAVLGARSIINNPEVLHAMNPYWALHFFIQYKTVSFFALGAWCWRSPALKRCMPIWATLVSFRFAGMVCGGAAVAGAQLFRRRAAAGASGGHQNPFFLLAPDWALIPMLILATLATVIASQAVISGVFSLTRRRCVLAICRRCASCTRPKRNPARFIFR